METLKIHIMIFILIILTDKFLLFLNMNSKSTCSSTLSPGNNIPNLYNRNYIYKYS